MTENTVPLEDLPEAVQAFVLQWGDMGAQWGVNRSVAQVHALLYITERPLPAEEIAGTLGIARSNVSNSLKELQGFGIVRRVPVPGDRRDHFAAETDVWEMAKRIGQVRKQREFDPALATLAHCLDAAEGETRVSGEQRRRLEAMRDLTVSVDRWYEQMLRVPTKSLARLVGMGNKVVSLVGLGGKSDAKPRGNKDQEAA